MNQFAIGDRCRDTWSGRKVGTVYAVEGHLIQGRSDVGGHFRLPASEFVPHVDAFPIPADKDPWRELEPRELRGPLCGETHQDELSARMQTTWACNRVRFHGGHHVARVGVTSEVWARWPREGQYAAAMRRGLAAAADMEATGKREQAPLELRAGMRFVREPTCLGTAGELQGRRFLVDAGKHVTIQGGEPVTARGLVWLDLEDSEDPSGHAPKGVEWRLDSFFACFRPEEKIPGAEKSGPVVGMEVVRTRYCSVGPELAADDPIVGARGKVEAVHADEFDVYFDFPARLGSVTYRLDKFGTAIIPAAEWDARESLLKNKTLTCNVRVQSTDPRKIAAEVAEAVRQQLECLHVVSDGKLAYAPVDLGAGDFYGPPTRYELTDVFVAKLAIAMFEEDNAGTVARVTNGGKPGAIGADEARERLVWLSTECQRDAYLAEARALLKRVGELP